MKLHVVLLLLIASPVFAKDDITKELMTSAGKTRLYYLYVPSTLKPGTPAPLIVTLPGSNRTGITLVEKWKDLAKKKESSWPDPMPQTFKGGVLLKMDLSSYATSLSRSNQSMRLIQSAFTCLVIRQAQFLISKCR